MMVVFQSSPGGSPGCDTLADRRGSAWFCGFNPHPGVAPGATLGDIEIAFGIALVSILARG